MNIAKIDQDDFSQSSASELAVNMVLLYAETVCNFVCEPKAFACQAYLINGRDLLKRHSCLIWQPFFSEMKNRINLMPWLLCWHLQSPKQANRVTAVVTSVGLMEWKSESWACIRCPLFPAVLQG